MISSQNLDVELRVRILADSLREAGVPIWGFLGRAELCESCGELPPDVRAGYGVDEARGLAAVALPYGEGPASPPAWTEAWPGPLARLGRFARANWYAEVSARLKDAAVRARAAIRKAGADPGGRRAWRHLANSALPEKRLAVAAGLGQVGRHSLVMVKGAGPACVLGLLLLPFDPTEGRPPNTRALELALRHERDSEDQTACSACRACAEACPTGAIRPGTGIIRERCLQHWAALDAVLPPDIEAAWGDRLYGCDTCIQACPRFHPDTEASTGRGALGPGLPASWLLEATVTEIRDRLRGSALGLGWMSPAAFRRNAALALRGRV